MAKRPRRLALDSHQKSRVPQDTMDTSKVRQKWQDWLSRIFEEQLYSLLASRHVFNNLRECLKTYAGSEEGATLAQWMAYGYAVSACLGVRRMSDRDRRNLSLVRLLKDLQQHPEELTFQRFYDMYAQADPHLAASYARKWFSKITGDQKAECVSSGRIQQDLNAILAAAAPTKELCNKVFAHTDKKKRQHHIRVPSCAQVDEAIDLFVKVFHRYELLIRGQNQVVDTQEFDVMSDLRKVWP